MPESTVLRVIIIVVGAYVLFEIVEHAVIPLIWLLLKKQRKSPAGVSGMVGEVGVVKEWHRMEGMIFVHGELWKAVSEDHLSKGRKVEVLEVNGLTLKVKAQPNPVSRTNGHS
jgi:membrane-bound ClpP family serine protease